MSDLFGNSPSFTRIPLEGAVVEYMSHFPLPVTPERALEKLIEETPWRSEAIVVWGKTHKQPRLIAWFGDDKKVYKYSGVTFNPIPWTDFLQKIKAAVESQTNENFNSVLLNYYRDNRDSIGLHSDDEPELGDRPVIASVSLGQERTFIFKPKKNLSLRSLKLKLESGSLLIMKGDTQRNWKHGIDKESKPCGPRINLTFRKIRT